MEITIDTNVLVRSDVAGDPARGPCLVFLREFKSQGSSILVLDEEDLIQEEYEDKVRFPKYGYHWLKHILLVKRYVKYPRADLPRRALHRLLDRCHMDPDDVKLFVRTAYASTSKQVVTYDGGYWGKARLCMTRDLGLVVDSARTIHDRLCGRPFDECLRREMGG